MNGNLSLVSNASDMNNQGNVTGYRNGYDAFLWVNADGIQDLGTVDVYNQFLPSCINDQNQIIGHCREILTGVYGLFLWDQDNLSILDIPYMDSFMLNNSGMIAGTYDDPDSDLYRIGLWKDEQFVDLGKGQLYDLNNQEMLLVESDDYPVDYPPYRDDVYHIIHGAERFDIRQLAELSTDIDLSLECINNNGWIGGFLRFYQNPGFPIDHPVLLVPKADRSLDNVVIIGPQIVYENSIVSFRAVGICNDNCPMALTEQVTWEVYPQSVGAIDPNGFLQVGDLDGIDEIIVTAEYIDERTFRVFHTFPVHEPRQLYVPTDYPTIQSAIDAAVDTDEVIIEDGTYTGDGNRDINIPDNRITVKSLNGPESCIIDAEGTQSNQHAGFILWPIPNKELIIEGLKITNAYPGIKFLAIVSGGEPPIKFNNCIIANNNGNGIEKLYGVLNNCIISGNIGHGIRDGSGQIYNSTIIGNDSGIYNSNVTVVNSKIGSNVFSAFDGCNSAQVKNSIINGNIYGFVECDMTVVNSIISGNICGVSDNGDNTFFSNCIFYKNKYDAILCIFSPIPSLDYCLFYRNGNDLYQEREDPENNGQIEVRYFNGADEINTLPEANGTLDLNPLFVNPGYWDDNGTPENETDDIWIEGDYHLKSEGWSWDVASQQWAWDDETSPCIDAGNPGVTLGDEPTTLDVDPLNRWGENIRINMGAYGGTAEASMAPPGWMLLCDLDNSGRVDLSDFATMAAAWLQSAANLPPDVSRNGTVNLDDVALLAQDWLKITTWY